jgi:acyl transferase domain-containing protein
MDVAKDSEKSNGVIYAIDPVAVNGITEINDHRSLNGVKTVNGANRDTEKTFATSSKQVNGHQPDGASKGFEAVTSPIAIVGMAMRLPGGVRDTDSFWDLLANKKDGRCRVPKDRYNIDAFYSPYGKKGMVTVDDGYFLEDLDLYALDESFFSILQFEAETVDPQQRVLLEVVWECMENAGQTNWRGSNIGCFVGSFGEDWLDMAAKDTQNLGIYRISGSCDFMLSNRVSYEYDLKGPR